MATTLAGQTTAAGDWYWDGSSAELAEIVRIRAAYERTPYKEFERRIAEFRADYVGMSPAALDHGIAKLLDRHLLRTRPLWLQGVYRARRHAKPGEFFKNVFDELWHPKPQYVKTRGRLNDAGQPVFYCAPRRNIAGLEVGAKVGDWVTLLAADKVDRRRQLNVVALGLERCHDPILDSLGGYAKDDGRVRMTLQSKTSYAKWLLVDDFISDLLSQVVPDGEEDRYKASVALVKRLQAFRVDGFLYPSIATRLQGINLCLTTAAADSHFRPLSCHVFRIDAELPGPLFLTSRIASSSSIAADGVITWQQHDHGPADPSKIDPRDGAWGLPTWTF